MLTQLCQLATNPLQAASTSNARAQTSHGRHLEEITSSLEPHWNKLELHRDRLNPLSVLVAADLVMSICRSWTLIQVAEHMHTCTPTPGSEVREIKRRFTNKGGEFLEYNTLSVTFHWAHGKKIIT